MASDSRHFVFLKNRKRKKRYQHLRKKKKTIDLAGRCAQ